jgi:Kelch motif
MLVNQVESSGWLLGISHMGNVRFKSIAALLFVAVLCAQTALATGTWVRIANPPPAPVDLMHLLPDGRIMAEHTGTTGVTNIWYAFTLLNGSYTNGTWKALASAHDTRASFASQVLTDGRVFIAGGELGSGLRTAEVYNPVNDTWTSCPPLGQNIADAPSEMLPDGRVLVAPVDGYPIETMIYSPVSNAWVAGPSTAFHPGTGSQNEASWVKLPDSSILAVDNNDTNSERYIPSLNKWVKDATVPVSLWDPVLPGSNLYEIGPAILLPSGKAIFFGSTGHTALYTPSGTTNAGVWVAGPDIPAGQMVKDAPAAMLVNGKVLIETSPVGTYAGQPVLFYEYDPSSNSFASVSTNGLDMSNGGVGFMLALPDGNVLCSLAPLTNLFLYRPDGSPVAGGKPTISGVLTNLDGSYHLTGTLLNGISAGAVFGDDGQMNGNYPLVRLSDGSGNVYYARTFNWSSTGVMTGNTPVTTEFRVPPGVPPGTYSLVVVANGNSSDPVTFRFQPDPLLVTPLTGFIGSGPVGGPFPALTQSYSLTNIGSSSIAWSLVNTCLWLNVSSSNGVLMPSGPAATVNASLSAAAAGLDKGFYTAVLTLSNVNSGVRQNLTFSLQVEPLVENGGFELGLADWTTGTSSGIPPSATVDAHFGTYAAFLWYNSTDFLSQNVPTIPGQLYSLSFWLKTTLAGVSTNNEFLVLWNGTNILDASNLVLPTWTNLVFTLQATSSVMLLEFTVQNDPATFFQLDDVSVTPIPRPVFRSVTRTNNTIGLTWSTVSGLVYQVQATASLTPTNWSNLDGTMTAAGSTLSASDAIGTATQRFYRVLLVP